MVYDNAQAHSMRNIHEKGRIYLIGPCIAEGMGCKAEDTLMAYLQELVVQNQMMVVEVGIYEEHLLSQIEVLSKLPIRESDIY